MSLEIKQLLNDLEAFIKQVKIAYNSTFKDVNASARDWYNGYVYGVMQLTELLKKYDKYKFEKIW